MTRIVLIITVLFITISSYGQLSGNKSIPGDYPTIKAAIAALNAQGVGPGGVSFWVQGGHVETFTSYDDGTITASGISEEAPVRFCHADTGIKPRIIAPYNVSNPATVRGVIKFAGCEHIQFWGIDVEENPQNSAYYTQYGYAILKASGSKGSRYNEVRKCRVRLKKNNTGGAGIYLGHHNSTTTTIIPTTSESGTNSYNRIYENIIEDAYTGIYLNGYSSPAPYTLNDHNNDVGGAGGNTVREFGGGAFTAYGIRTQHQTDLTVQNNTIQGGQGTTVGISGINNSGNMGNGGIFNASSNTLSLTTSTASYPTYGIYNGISSTYSMSTVIISNNVIDHFNCPSCTTCDTYVISNTGSAGSLIIQGNTLQGGSSPVLDGDVAYIYNAATLYSTVSIQNNNLGGWTFTNPYTGYLYSMYCYNFGQQSNVLIRNNVFEGHIFNQPVNTTIDYLMVGGSCFSLTVTGNSWSNIYSNNAGTETLINNHASPLGYLNVTDNYAGNYTKTVADGAWYGYLATAATPAGCTETISGNRFEGIAALMPGSGHLYGFSVYDGSWTSTTYPWKQIFNNWFGNVNWPSTGSCQPMYFGKLGHNAAGAPSGVYSNTCSGVQASGDIYGLITGYDASQMAPPEVYSNTIDNLVSTGPSSKVQGCRLYSGPPGVNFSRNTISRLYANGTNGTVDGIYVASDYPFNISNNVIWGLDAPWAAPPNSVTETVVAINISHGNVVNTDYNTVFLNGTGINPWYSTACVSVSVTETVQFRNNILSNTSSSGTGGHTTVFKHMPGWNYGPGSNNNNFYVGPSGTANMIATDGSAQNTTLQDFQTAVSPADNHSVSESTPFVNTSTIPYDLHVRTDVPTPLESGGVTISAPVPVNNDRDGIPRYPNPGYPYHPLFNPVAPDIGAYEFGGLPKGWLPSTLTVTNVTIPSGSSNCYVAHSITVGGNGTYCIVQPGGTGTFSASGTIRFDEGCHFQQGGIVTARIVPDPTCGTQSPTIVTQPVGHPEEAAQDKQPTLTVYPNPTSGVFHLVLNEQPGDGSGDESVQAEIYSLTGELILSKTIAREQVEQFDLQGYPAGIYLLRIVQNGSARMVKILLI